MKNLPTTSDEPSSFESHSPAWAGSPSDFHFESSGATLHGLLVHSARTMPESVALACGDHVLTYRQLQARAVGPAQRLIEMKVLPGEIIGVCVPRGPEMVVAVLGVLIAGGAYLPLDPELPQARQRLILGDSGCRILVADVRRYPPPAISSVEIVDVGEASGDCGSESPELPPVEPDQLAYVIYTSGTTGKPKGVMVSHRRAANTILDVNRRFGIGPSSRVLALSSLGYDLSVYDIFGMLAARGTIVIPEAHQICRPAAWVDLINRHQVTVWNSVPALMEMLTAYCALHAEVTLGSLRCVLLSGDWVPVLLPKKVRTCAAESAIISLGGATEAAMCWVYHLIDDVDHNDKPLTNQTAYILDERLRPCPAETTGEIHIGGDRVGPGYLNQPQLTAERSSDDPFSNRAGNQFYRTGDLGRWLADGNREFLGPIGDQVKPDGFRIEFAEIEATLTRNHGVAEGNGKIDRAALPEPRNDSFAESRFYCPPQTSTERRLALLWAEVLNVEQIGRNADFIQLGGDSLQAIEVLVGIEQSFGVKLDLDSILENEPRLMQLARRIDEGCSAEYAPPRDNWELQLSQIWERHLDVRPLSIDANFFDLGGDLPRASRLMVEVSRQFGRNLATEVLAARPTIEKLAELLRGKPRFGQRSSLVVIQASGQHPPLICVPGIFGNIWEFRRLAQFLGPDFPLYALPPIGVDGVASPHETIFEMARHNVEQLRTVQPHGPYYLAGHSLGGTVAYEMAQILHSEGEKLPLFVMMDSPLRGHSRCFRAIQRIINRLTHRCSSSSRAPQGRGNEALSAGALAVAAGFSEDFDVEGAPPTAAGLRLLRTHRRALDLYRPRPYPGRVTIFRPQIGRKGFKRLFKTGSEGWIEICQKGGEIHVVPGDHSGMFNSEHIKTLANTLKTCLLAAIENPGEAEA